MKSTHLFEHEWVRDGELPESAPSTVDVAVLDMNYGSPNMGHDALVAHLRTIAHDLADDLERAHVRVRALSFDVRRMLDLPRHDGRFKLYVGTGGPGHLDPRQNDGAQPWAQGVDERDASWEAPLFELFDDIRSDLESGLVGICHTFGLLCRWSGVAEPSLRGSDKGGKSAGIVTNVLTDEALAHPWFGGIASVGHDGRRITVTDSRLFDLLPTGHVPEGMTVIAHEEHGDAVTMAEFARDADGTPRMLAVNNHPEIVRPALLREIMREKLEAHDVDETWVNERQALVTRMFEDPKAERALESTAETVLFAPLRTRLSRLVRERVTSDA